MAKKVLTPEQAEIKALKKAKKSENWTKFWAILLALVLAISVVFLGQSAAKDAIAKANQNANADSEEIVDENVDLFGDDEGGEDEDGDGSGSGDDSADQTPAVQVTKEDAVKAFNDATATAAKGSYHWKRTCWYTKPIDVGNATGTLNNIIKGVDKNADLNSVVGGFLDITGEGKYKEADVANGKAPEGMKEKFLIIPGKLTADDVTEFTQKGNTYTFKLKACANPQKDGSNALSRVTNDFITEKEVSDGITNAVGSAIKVESITVNFTSIQVVAQIKDGKLTSLKIGYIMDVKSINLKAAVVPITGTGAGAMKVEYSDFK